MGFFGRGGTPVVDLHDLGVHLQPVADFVFGRKHRPVIGEGQIGQMVIPDRVVQTEGFVTVAPAVAGACIFFHHDGGHTEAAQTRGQHDAALAAADDQHIRLFGVAQAGLLFLAQLQPTLAVLVRPVLGAFDTVIALFLFKAFELGHGGEQRPGFAAFQAQMAQAACHTRFKREPRIHHTIGFGGLALQCKVRRLHIFQAGGQHVSHSRMTLLGANVPGERDQIAPITIGLKQRCDFGGLAAGQGFFKRGKPSRGLLRWRTAHTSAFL